MIRNLQLLALFLLIGNWSVFSQNNPENSVDTSTVRKAQPKHSFTLDASYNASSNSLNNKFLNALNGTGELGSDALAGNFSDKDNFFFIDNTIALRYFRIHPAKASVFQGVAGGFRQFITTSFPSDAFSLIFHGNSAFAGDTAVLDGMNFLSQSYYFLNTTLQFSFPVSEDKQNKLILSLQPSLLLSKSANSLQIDQAGLYTAPYGQFLDIYANYHWNASASGFLNGIGAGLNAQLAWTPATDWHLSAVLQNLGVIHYNNRSEKIALDTSYHYEGIQFPVITELNTFTPDTGFADALMEDFYENQKQSGNFSAYTAATIEFRVIRYFKKAKIQAAAKSISYLQNLSMNYSSVDFVFSPFSKMSFSLNPGIAAYKHFFLNAGLRFRLGDFASVRLDIGDLTGFISPEKAHYQRLSCSLFCSF